MNPVVVLALVAAGVATLAATAKDSPVPRLVPTRIVPVKAGETWCMTLEHNFPPEEVANAGDMFAEHMATFGHELVRWATRGKQILVCVKYGSDQNIHEGTVKDLPGGLWLQGLNAHKLVKS